MKNIKIKIKNKTPVIIFANVPADKIAICENFFFVAITFSFNSTNAAKKIGKTVEKKGILSFTDSMSFVKKGIKSAGIVALQPNGDMPRFYHTTNDTFDIIDPNLLRDCLKICIQTIQDIDENISKRF